MVARLGDFGIANFYQDLSLTREPNATSSIGVKGTIGYIAPGILLLIMQHIYTP
jgi:serine/threonine protein kinase